ncbi:MAG: hypothetical protein QRY72_01820 [Candidatus Rhabdochlamydia sp.]
MCSYNQPFQLQQVCNIPKEEWIQAIHARPGEASLYCHLARRLDMGETAKINASKSLTPRLLFLEAFKLDPQNGLICYYFAEKLHALYLYREKWESSLPNGQGHIRSRYYQKAISYAPLCCAAYIKAADLLFLTE